MFLQKFYCLQGSELRVTNTNVYRCKYEYKCKYVAIRDICCNAHDSSKERVNPYLVLIK